MPEGVGIFQLQSLQPPESAEAYIARLIPAAYSVPLTNVSKKTACQYKRTLDALQHAYPSAIILGTTILQSRTHSLLQKQIRYVVLDHDDHILDLRLRLTESRL